MTSVNERVKDFLENWTGIIVENVVCARCGEELTDGNFAMLDGVLMCLKCKEEKDGRPNFHDQP